MPTQDRATKLRELYITRYGKEPNALILGNKALMDLQHNNPDRFFNAGGVYLGMRIIIDKDKTSKVEVGDFEI